MATDTEYAEQFKEQVELPGMGGLNVLDPPEMIADNELSNCQNVIFRNGILAPRQGSYLFASKPSGETGSPISMIKGLSSDKQEYSIAKYGTAALGFRYYLWDNTNSDWINITGSYNSTQALPDGYASWNNGDGIGYDVVYGGNGTDDVWKWYMGITTLAVTSGSSDAQITVADGSHFSQIGTLNNLNFLVNNAGTLVPLTATSVSQVINIPNQPANGQQINLIINNSAITQITFVSVIGVTAGNVLIGATLANTISNLLGLLQNPATTSSTQVAFSSGNQTLIGYFTYTSASGNIIMAPGGSVTSIEAFINILGSSIQGNVINISGTVGSAIPAGSGVTTVMVDLGASFGANGNIFLASQGRLLISGGKYSANTVWYSVLNSAESFDGTDTTRGGSEFVVDSFGPVLGLADFGSFVAVIKKDKISQFTLTQNSANTTIIASYVSAAQSIDVGMFAPFTAVSANNSIYYPTASNGITQMNPTATGYTLTVTPQTQFSEKILPLCTNIYSFLNGRSTFFNQQLLFAAGIPSVNYTTSPNDVAVKNTDVLLYDLTFQAWSVLKGWGVQDWIVYQNNLYYLSNVDGNVYQCFVGQDDNGNGYLSSASGKNYNYGNAAMPKTEDYTFVKGVISRGATLNAMITFEQNGQTLTQNYAIPSDLTASDGTALINFPTIVPLGGSGGLGGDLPLGGGVPTEDETSDDVVKGSFALYLNTSAAVGFLTKNIEVWSEDTGAYWEFAYLAANPQIEGGHPVEYDISPST